MKKFMTFIVIYFVFSFVTFSQEPSYLCLSDSQIDEIIKKSNEKYNHLKNIHLIYPGQTLIFELYECVVISKKVSPGDNQWDMVSKLTEDDLITYSLLVGHSWKRVDPINDSNCKSEPIKIKVPYGSIVGSILVIGSVIGFYFYLKKRY